MTPKTKEPSGKKANSTSSRPSNWPSPMSWMPARATWPWPRRATIRSCKRLLREIAAEEAGHEATLQEPSAPL